MFALTLELLNALYTKKSESNTLPERIPPIMFAIVASMISTSEIGDLVGPGKDLLNAVFEIKVLKKTPQICCNYNIILKLFRIYPMFWRFVKF